MKILVLYRPISEHARAIDEFSHEFSRRYPDLHLELLDIDSREGSATASIYDVTAYPALLALRFDGAVSMVWQGEPLPLLDEVVGYARQ